MAKAANDAIVDDCDGRPGCDTSLADVTFALVERLEAEIAAFPPVTMQGLALFVWQEFIEVFQLELINYIEHYGLTRRHLGDGRYETVQPHHSWNAAHRASNWFLINLQRHSDHHTKPDRRYPLLQNHGPERAPQLPFGYSLSAAIALVPPLWRRMMNPRVRQWRSHWYPDITDWTAYNCGTNPPPRNAA